MRFVYIGTFLSPLDSEMHGMYLKSVRSPVAPGHRFKMVYKPSHHMNIFSQVLSHAPTSKKRGRGGGFN